MKTFIACLLLVPTLVFGKGIAYMVNDGGGKIVITNEPCWNKERTQKYDGLFRIYTYNSTGATAEGCFEFEDETIHVFWPEYKKEARYSLKDFIVFENK